jgi:CRISPR-associated protein Csy1
MGNKTSKESELKRRALDHLKRNRLVESRTLFMEACERGSTDAEIWYNLAILNGRLGALNGVEPCLRRALALKPGFTEAALRLGETLAYLGRLPEAVEILQKLAAGHPDLTEAWMKLGNIVEAAGNHAAAIACYQHVAARTPHYEPVHTCLGNAQYFIGEFAAARQAYQRAAKLNPDSLRAQLGKLLSLPHIYESRQHMLEARAEFMEGIAKLAAMEDRFKRSPTLIDDLQWSYNFYLAYQGLDDRPAQEAFGKFFTAMVGHALPQFMQPIPARPVAGRRIRVGYAAHFFHSHTVSFYFNNWILRADRERFETFVYHINPVADATSRRLAEGCTQYRPVTGAIAGIAQCIRNDALDILVFPEVGMYSKTQWLAALRLAPVQCAAWGHPVTTGLASIDYALSAAATEPADAQRHYTERLVCLDGLGVCLDAPVPAPPASREELGLPVDRNLYLCSQSLFKIHVDMDAIMVALAGRDPDALILLFDDPKPAVKAAYQRRIHAAFAAEGLDPERFIRFLPRMSPTDFLRVNRLADVMIDTPHWSGGRTSLDALGAGLPIVTLPGEFSRGRQTLGMLEAIGLTELVATDSDDYVVKAVAVARDGALKARLSGEILARAPGVLFDNPAPVTALEDRYRAWAG